MGILTEEQIDKLRREGKIPSYKNIFPPNIENLYDSELVNLIGKANRAIGNLNSYARIVPNPDLVVHPMLLREALDSSEIEGTISSARDVAEEDVGLVTSHGGKPEATEVRNHIKATRLGISLLDSEMPIVTRSIKAMHETLLTGVRGQEHLPGNFREWSNIVAPQDVKESGEIEKIIYIPPKATEIPQLMSRLDTFINTSSPNMDLLLKCSLIHYEFEAIHPFLDGNGRIGRVLISLHLIQEGVLEYPLLYMSGFLLKNKKEYFKRLSKITTEEGWSEWFKFFLTGVTEQSQRSRKILESIRDLYEKHKEQAKSNIKSSHVEEFVKLYFTSLVVNANLVKDKLGVKHATAMNLLQKASELGLLSKNNRKKRYVPFYNESLISLLERS